MNLYLTKFQQRNAATGNWVTGMGTKGISALKTAGLSPEVIEILGNNWNSRWFLARFQFHALHSQDSASLGIFCPRSVWPRWSDHVYNLEIFFGLPSEPFAVLILWSNRSKSGFFAFKPSIFCVSGTNVEGGGHQSSVSQIQSVVLGQRFLT